MTDQPLGNPFAPGTSTRKAGPRAGYAAWAAFSVQRAVRLVALPMIFGLVAAIWQGPQLVTAWVGVVAAVGTSAVWLPTTIWIAWLRFLRPSTDDRGLLMTTGEVIDRDALKQLYLARTIEFVLLGLALLAVAAGFIVRFGAIGIPVLLLVVGFLVWTTRIAWAQVWVGEALVRYAGGEGETVLDAIDKARPARIRARTADALETLAAQAWVRRGDPEAALAHLSRVQGKRAVHADIVEAVVRLGRDEVPPPALLREAEATVGRAVGITQLRTMTALHTMDPDRALQELDAWREARGWLPWLQRTTLDLVRAAAHQQRGEPDMARAVLKASGVHLEDRAWIAAVWPRWWALLEAIPDAEG